MLTKFIKFNNMSIKNCIDLIGDTAIWGALDS